MECICCQSELKNGLDTWHHVCHQCGYESAALQSEINNHIYQSVLDEVSREQGLKPLRLETFKKLFNLICTYVDGHAKRLLDVGAAHGWFLEVASKRFEVMGIEPDQSICQATAKRNIPVVEGFFPDVLTSENKFDVIVFNDVFEHIPKLDHVLSSCHHHLEDNGLLVLNLPSSQGIFYRLSKLLKRISLDKPFKRMWQVGLPSPHLHYFSADNLSELLSKKHGFSVLTIKSLPTIRFKGLYQRIAYVKGLQNRITSLFLWSLIVLSIPFLRLFDSDIMVIIARKQTH